MILAMSLIILHYWRVPGVVGSVWSGWVVGVWFDRLTRDAGWGVMVGCTEEAGLKPAGTCGRDSEDGGGSTRAAGDSGPAHHERGLRKE